MMATKKTTKSKVMTKKKTVKKTALKSTVAKPDKSKAQIKSGNNEYSAEQLARVKDLHARAKETITSAKETLRKNKLQPLMQHIKSHTEPAGLKITGEMNKDSIEAAIEFLKNHSDIRPNKNVPGSTGYFSRDDAPVKKLTEKELDAAREELRKQRKPPSSVNYAKQAMRIKELIDSGIISINDLSVMTDYGVTQEAIELYKQQYTRTKSLDEELDEAEAEADDEYVCVDEEPSGNVETGFFSRSGSLVEQTVNTHPTAKELGEVYKLESDAGDYYAGKLAESLKLANTPVELKAAIKDIEDFEEKYVQAVKYHLKTKRNLIVMETHLKKIYAELKNDQA